MAIDVTINQAYFSVHPKSNYQNYYFTLSINRPYSELNCYIVFKQKTPIQNTSTNKYIYYYIPLNEYVTSNVDGGKYTYTYIPWGVAEWWFGISEKPGKYNYMNPIIFPGGMHWDFPCVFSDVPYDIYLTDRTSPYNLRSNVVSDVRTPFVNLFRENFDDYKGLECTLIGDAGADNYYTKADGVYFPIVKNQTLDYSTGVSVMNSNDTWLSIQSCVGCATSSAFEFMNYKTTKSVKVYSSSYIYGAATEDSNNPRYYINGRSNLIDLSGMYYSDAATVCISYGVPSVDSIYYNKYDAQYSYSPIEGYPCIKFEQEYTDDFGTSSAFKARANAKLLYTSMRNTRVHDKITSYSVMTQTGNILKNAIKSATLTSNRAVIVSSSKSINADDNGIASSSEGLSGGHAMLIIGWITLNGVFHWVCHNSWGKYGDNGKIYLSINHSSIADYYLLSGFTKARPDNWKWYSPIVQGEGTLRLLDLGTSNESEALLSAREWIDFCGRINEFRVYKGLSVYNFSEPSPGGFIVAILFNQALTALGALSSYMSGQLPTSKSIDNPILASDLILLQNALNSIQ